ncbi:MAG TPA: autotransporter-associated beta strand repeat-containing protein, partial [Chthoniobacterales bacterium]
TFGVSAVTDVSIAADTAIGSIAFSAGADPFTIRTTPGPNDITLTVSGTGITNDSGIAQNLALETNANDHGSAIAFTRTATVGPLTTITLEGNSSGKAFWGASTVFNDQCSAGDGTFYSLGSSVPVSYGGATYFFGDSTAGEATLTSDGGAVSGAGGGTIWFWDNSTAGDAVITCNGGTVAGAGGGFISFTSESSTGHATLIANGGLNGGGGGQILFGGDRTLESTQPRVQIYGNGVLSIFDAESATVQVGSIEGDGIVTLGGKELIVGANGLSTTFTGTINGIHGGHALTKIGDGTLTLSGANTYTALTTVSEGTLVLANTTGSATGTGGVTVNGGTLGGSGIIGGAVTIATGAVLAPAAGSNTQATLTTQSTLSLQTNATYKCTAQARGQQVRADKVVANGVTITGGKFSFKPRISGTLQAGTAFTVIGNTSTSPIHGTFSNLPDGAIITSGGANFQASYEGGDNGNDLTLTVVP